MASRERTEASRIAEARKTLKHLQEAHWVPTEWTNHPRFVERRFGRFRLTELGEEIVNFHNNLHEEGDEMMLPHDHEQQVYPNPEEQPQPVRGWARRLFTR
jgi:hypothetical protein